MLKPLTPAKQREKVQKAYEYAKWRAEQTKGSHNPQTIAMHNQEVGRMEALESVLEMMKGQNFLINLAAEKEIAR